MSSDDQQSKIRSYSPARVTGQTARQASSNVQPPIPNQPPHGRAGPHLPARKAGSRAPSRRQATDAPSGPPSLVPAPATRTTLSRGDIFSPAPVQLAAATRSAAAEQGVSIRRVGRAASSPESRMPSLNGDLARQSSGPPAAARASYQLIQGVLTYAAVTDVTPTKIHNRTAGNETSLPALDALAMAAGMQCNERELQAKKVKAFREFAQFSSHKDRSSVKAKLRERMTQVRTESEALVELGLDVLGSRREKGDFSQEIESPRKQFTEIDREVAFRGVLIERLQETLCWVENLDLGFPDGVAPRRSAPMILV